MTARRREEAGTSRHRMYTRNEMLSESKVGWGVEQLFCFYVVLLVPFF